MRISELYKDVVSTVRCRGCGSAVKVECFNSGHYSTRPHADRLDDYKELKRATNLG